MRYLLVAILLLGMSAPCAAADALILYRMGQDHPGWAMVKEYFDGRGFNVAIYQGETTIEKHLERASRINRSAQGIFIALEFASGQKPGAVVIAPAFEKRSESGPQPQAAAEGRSEGQPEVPFYSIDELPARHAEASNRLAESVASGLGVKARQMPLFPVLGINMPGVFVRLECRDDQVKESLGKLLDGLENYMRRDTKK